MARASGSVCEICASPDASIWASIADRRPSFALSVSMPCVSRATLADVTVEVDLEHRRRVIARPTGCLRLNIKAQRREIKCINVGIDHPHWIGGFDHLIDPLRK